MESKVVRREVSIEIGLCFKVSMGRSTILKVAHFKLKVTSLNSLSLDVI